MPKSKKPKVVSLVAYQSGDDEESESGSGTKSNESDSQDSEHSDDESSKKSSDYEIEVSNEKHLQHENHAVSDNDDSTKFKGQEESITGEFSNTRSPIKTDSGPGDIAEKPMEVQEDTESSEEQPGTSFKLTLEEGFPPGCERIKLPSAPKAPCSQSLQNKIVQVVDRMNRFNYSINEDIRSKKSFKNPSIYEKLIEAYGIDEFGSSFPTHIEDLKANGYMFYDDLDAEQRLEWAKLEKTKKDRTKIEMVSGTKKNGK